MSTDIRIVAALNAASAVSVAVTVLGRAKVACGEPSHGLEGIAHQLYLLQERLERYAETSLFLDGDDGLSGPVAPVAVVSEKLDLAPVSAVKAQETVTTTTLPAVLPTPPVTVEAKPLVKTPTPVKAPMTKTAPVPGFAAPVQKSTTTTVPSTRAKYDAMSDGEWNKLCAEMGWTWKVANGEGVVTRNQYIDWVWTKCAEYHAAPKTAPVTPTAAPETKPQVTKEDVSMAQQKAVEAIAAAKVAQLSPVAAPVAPTEAPKAVKATKYKTADGKPTTKCGWWRVGREAMAAEATLRGLPVPAMAAKNAPWWVLAQVLAGVLPVSALTATTVTATEPPVKAPVDDVAPEQAPVVESMPALPSSDDGYDIPATPTTYKELVALGKTGVIALALVCDIDPMAPEYKGKSGWTKLLAAVWAICKTA